MTAHHISILQHIAPDKPLVCKCRRKLSDGTTEYGIHAVDVCPKLTADRDWGAIVDRRHVTESWVAQQIANPPALDPQLISKENLFAWVPAAFSGRRDIENAQSKSIVGLDFDHVADRDAFLARVRALGLRAHVHASFTVRNADGTWRIRVYLYLDRPATPPEWLSVAAWVRATFPEVDAATLDIARLLFFPVATPGYWHEIIEGGALQLDPLLAAVPSLPAPRPRAPTTSSTKAAELELEEEPERLRDVPQAERERRAEEYLQPITKHGDGDGSNQLVRLMSVVARGFACGASAVRLIAGSSVGQSWSESEIERRYRDVMRRRERPLGFMLDLVWSELQAELDEQRRRPVEAISDHEIASLRQAVASAPRDAARTEIGNVLAAVGRLGALLENGAREATCPRGHNARVSDRGRFRCSDRGCPMKTKADVLRALLESVHV